MRQWKLSADAAFFGAQRDSYTQYHPDRTLEGKFAPIAQLVKEDGKTPELYAYLSSFLFPEA